MRENEKIAEVFGKLVSIDSPSLKEREMADYLKKLFGEIGVELEEDQTGEATGPMQAIFLPGWKGRLDQNLCFLACIWIQ